jgi:hypothetical protein
MDFGSSSLYGIELWSQSGQMIADISRLCHNITYSMTRNDVETLQFDIDLFAFEQYCKTNLGNADPSVLLKPYATDIKFKRAGTYLFGCQVVSLSFNLAGDSSSSGTSTNSGVSDYPMTVSCTGYLNYFKDRYVTKTYTSNERVAIACDLITTTQATTNGSFGVTIPGGQYSTTKVDSQRTYALDQVKLKLQELANASDYPFDFAFTWDKKFQTYSKIGAIRSDISYIYGGPLSNVQSFSMDRSASSLYNTVVGLGSGFGTAQLTSNQSDAASQLNYFRREEISQYNSVIEQATLDTNTLTDVAVHKDLLELPKITINSKQLPAAMLSVGDRIPLKVQAHPMLANINGTYRIEVIECRLDDNQFETFTLTLDNYGL